MLNLETVKHDIEQWIVNFVEVPHPALGGFPPCPYARSARLKNTYDVRVGVHPYYDLVDLAKIGLGDKEVIVIAYDANQWSHDIFYKSLELANIKHLLPKDILVLEDHPGDPEIVNGVSMNQGKYALALVQGLSDLNTKAKIMARKGFYDSWPEEYLTSLFQHREDPRQS
jgi:hypothetical protein